MRSRNRKYTNSSEKLQKKRQRYLAYINDLEKAYEERRDLGIACFNDQRRVEIYNDAKEMGFAPSDLEMMKHYLEPEHWNQDEIDKSRNEFQYDAIDLFEKAEKFVDANANPKPFLKSLFDKISLIGAYLDEKEEDNDN